MDLLARLPEIALPTGVLLPLAFGLLIALAPRGDARLVRGLALAGTLLPVGWLALVLASFDFPSGQNDQFVWSAPWFEPLALRFSMGMDTVSLLLVALTVLLGPICVLASYTAITERPRTYYSWLLILQAAMTGVFLARDLVLFYVFFEFTLVPLYVLINLYGSTNRRAAATKFFLYTFTGSLVTLAGLVYVAWQHRVGHGQWTFDIAALGRTARAMSFDRQSLVFWAMLCGFAIKVPLFPVHTWLPLAHTEAPTAGSVILAGVLLKLGTYGILKFVIPFNPAAATAYAPALAVLSIIGIVYGGLICWVQTDVKKLVAYSSVSHLGFCVLGLFSLNGVGLTGGVLYMINHGLSTGALFLLIGFMYERYHTRSLKELGGLAKVMPVWASFMVFFAMASVGLPGLNGFVSEFMCMLGAFQAAGARWGAWSGGAAAPGATAGELGPWFALAAGTGVIVTAMYLLYMLGRVVWGPLAEPAGHGHHGPEHGHGGGGHQGPAHAGAGAGADHPPALPRDLSAREIGTLLPLAALCLALGLFPTPLLRVLERPMDQVAATVQEHGRDRAPARTPAPSSPSTAGAGGSGRVGGEAGVRVVPAAHGPGVAGGEHGEAHR